MPARPAPVSLLPPLSPRTRQAERQRALTDLRAEIRVCRACEAAGHLASAHPVAPADQPATARLMIIGQAPGHLTVERDRMFSGPSGDALERWLTLAGFAPGALRREVYLSALTRCDPGRSAKGSGDRKPSASEVAFCRPWLERELAIVRPRAILLVGGMAIEAFIGRAALDDVVGSVVERAGVALIPLPHPSGVSRWLNDTGHQALLRRGLARLAELRAAWEAEDALSARRGDSAS